MPDNKIIVRRLPPSMKEDDFLRQVSPLPEHDYFCYFDANPSLGQHAYSRAYINFVNTTDMDSFRQRFDNHVFLNKDGREYPAVVESSLWHKGPKSGPFFINNDTEGFDQNRSTSEIEKDEDFIEFLERLKIRKKGPQNSPIQTIEANLDELTNQAGPSCSKEGRDNTKVITPLIGYVNQKRMSKNQKKTR